MKWLQFIQIAVAILLMITILMQNKGAGLSGIFGGGGDIFRTKRGAEKILFISTIIFATIFFVIGVISIIIKK
jgi:preprotein translocase subunit SecG